jgi:hypothetical protein
MNLEELETEALKLSPDLRARLAEKLLHSLEALSDAENERLWAEEALRRHDELESGAAAVRSGEDVFRDARSRLP